MYTVTFYSYRGGVGRTTALVNSAIDLALRKRNVLLVDFDLESPGISNFPALRPENGEHPGLVEFIDHYLRLGKAPDITDYVYRAKPLGENCGEVWVMPAGRGDDDYLQAFHKINWQELYDLQDGFVLFEDIKFQWRESFRPDYVLIDARAGINDRLDICTRQLPDAVVVVFTPDSAGETQTADQAGVQRVLRDVVAESLQSSPPRIDVLTVATKIPDLDGSELDVSSWNKLAYDTASDELEIFDVDLAATIPHAPELLLERQVVANPRHQKRLARAYRQLANALIRSNYGRDREGAQAFLTELQRHPSRAVAVPAIDLVDRWFDATGRLDQVIKNFGDDAEILAQAASCLYLAGRYQEAMDSLDTAIELAPDSDSIRWQRASYRRHMKLEGPSDPRHDLLRLLDSSRPAPPRRLGLIRLPPDFFARSGGVMSPGPELTELDTTPIDTADPLRRDFLGIDPYVASAFLQLRRLGGEAEALQKPGIQQLSSEQQQALIAETPITTLHPDIEPEFLIYHKQWRKAIAVLEARVAQSSVANPGDLFNLAMAFWGAGNEARASEYCRSATELMLKGKEIDTLLQELATDDIEMIPLLSLMFWRAEDAAAANRLLDRCDELLSEVSEADDFFSVWRYRRVKRDQFEEDCHLLRKMIMGAAIPPHFLDKGPAGS